MRFELTTWEEDELEFDRCLQAARDKLALTSRTRVERADLHEFDALAVEDE